MKKIVLPVFVLMSLVSFGQVKKKTTTAAPAQPVLKTINDSLSYAIGISVAGFYKEQGVKDVNTNLVARAINDALKSGKPLLNDQQCNSVIIGYVQKERAAKAEGNKKAGEAFLAENKTKTGVVTLPSGLQYQILKEGNGPKPTTTDKVKCHYEGKLIDGSVFESSYQRGEPIEFSVTGVIRGWTEALQLMPVGSKWRLFIPSDLAYGDQGNGAIKPGSTLVFDVELLDIVK
ncbi:MAG: FKBP-type peptidyl-prolyl cis-trans isomerase [Bacteroidetes bacterium]|nr:FKBP-type peptidyl-prolyl cis-trans isomerase [Bacteroidota bacterium]MBS1934348.1 FKBP-type peptidyl-prolyl cis-trans isomerase [Bacteroidota bacterium]